MLKISKLGVKFKKNDAINQVIQDISFELKKGQTLAIVGESGSGKSVSCMAIMKLLPENLTIYDSNSKILFNDLELLSMSDKELRKIRGNKIAMIPQEAALNPYMRVINQVIEAFLAHNPSKKKIAKEIASEKLQSVGIPKSKINAYPHEFSGGQLQRIMIAMAVINQPELLIADEATTALDRSTQKKILDLLSQLQNDLKMGMILISHDLKLVEHYSEHLCIMQNGRIVDRGNTKQIFQNPLHAYTKELLKPIPVKPIKQDVEYSPLGGKGLTCEVSKEEFSRMSENQKSVESDLKERTKPFRPLLEVDEKRGILLNVRNLEVDYVTEYSLLGRPKNKFNAVKNVSFHLGYGETLGIIGESGSGKSSIGKAILELTDYRGEIQFEGSKKDMQMVFQNPYNSLSPRLTVEEILLEGLKEKYPNMLPKDRKERVLEALLEVKLRAEMMDRYPHEFSGGQRQRIAIARAIITEPKFIVLDEPTSALDRTTQVKIIELLNRLQRKLALSYIFITHDLNVVKATSDRLMVLKDGAVVESGTVSQILGSPKDRYTRELLNQI